MTPADIERAARAMALADGMNADEALGENTLFDPPLPAGRPMWTTYTAMARACLATIQPRAVGRDDIAECVSRAMMWARQAERLELKDICETETDAILALSPMRELTELEAAAVALWEACKDGHLEPVAIARARAENALLRLGRKIKERG
jgi:hypothetical protein